MIPVYRCKYSCLYHLRQQLERYSKYIPVEEKRRIEVPYRVLSILYLHIPKVVHNDFAKNELNIDCITEVGRKELLWVRYSVLCYFVSPLELVVTYSCR